MHGDIESAVLWFRRINLDGIPVLLQRNSTAFLSFVCVVAAIDALAGYRYSAGKVEERFRNFIEEYFPVQYTPHASKLYLFRCRMLHNFSPAHFSLVHAVPAEHLKSSKIGDTVLSDDLFFEHMRSAAERYFTELSASTSLQADMLSRLHHPDRGGRIGVSSAILGFRER
jgi:hypothetical protein